ncbi:GDSL-type esterase/lipase family protein [Domibacillus sp. A3M-37]|uniref:GDSL-type esterase/lipase family protein n=1 Tax=Domibacillus sp. A3M-37 TaxID=2962037 RepID=UPI0020B67D5E|nr:GDSL-type esterase/lipase family protein [Domibacillus sp. A3M-37]MCP3761343.1 GDSL-type esterase/lipase family protein [Domibacillus sp. A3M-37]
MKKYNIIAVMILFFVLISAFGGPVKAAEPLTAKVISSSLTVRDNASPHAKVVGSLAKYTVLYVYGSVQGGWSEIRFKNKKAYVPSSQLKTSKSTIVVAFGDSNTQGTNWNQNLSYAQKDKWVTKLGQTYGAVNAGAGGDTSVMGRARFQKDVLNKRPNVVTIMFGTNDAVIHDNGKARVSKAQFEQNIRYFVDTLKAKKVHVVLMTTPPVIQGLYYKRYDERLYTRYNGARQWHDSYNAIIRKVAKEKKVTLIDNYQNMSAAAGGVTDRRLISSGLIDSSGTHLTPKGADMIYQSVNRVLSK